jgi:hypothetical protein
MDTGMIVGQFGGGNYLIFAVTSLPAPVFIRIPVLF